MIWRAAAIWIALAGTAGAVDLALPSTARLMVERNTAPDSYDAPVSVFEDGAIETVTIEGDIARSAWRLGASGFTPLQVIRPLRQQLEDAGFRIVLECDAAQCGGFDFRFGIDVLPAPNMYVNIRDFRFLTAIRGDAASPESVVTLLVSTTGGAAYVQLVEAVARAAPTDMPDEGERVIVPAPVGDVGAQLMQSGHVVLSALDFETGTSALGPATFPTLDALADFLRREPLMRIALVGHTDTVGALDANITLSLSRASAVRRRLIDAYDIAPDRIEAQGMGYLAPVDTNLTKAGRDANRRVEAVLLPGPTGE